MREALLFDSMPNHQVRCHVCEHHCVINAGKRGICGVRENQNGILYALNDGLCIAQAIDPIEKKPLYHYLPMTKTYSIASVGCNMICPWCQNYEISQSPKSKKTIEGEDISPEEHVRLAIQNHCPSISYTYSEPTVFLEYALDTMKLAHEAGLKNIWVSNGLMSLKTLELITPYLDAANIDYKSREEVYHNLTLGHEDIIRRNLKYMHVHKIHVEITTLVIPEVNNNPVDLLEIATFIKNELDESVPWHLSRFFPIWKMTDHVMTPIPTLKMAKKIGEETGLKHVYLGNVW